MVSNKQTSWGYSCEPVSACMKEFETWGTINMLVLANGQWLAGDITCLVWCCQFPLIYIRLHNTLDLLAHPILSYTYVRIMKWFWNIIRKFWGTIPRDTGMLFFSSIDSNRFSISDFLVIAKCPLATWIDFKLMSQDFNQTFSNSFAFTKFYKAPVYEPTLFLNFSNSSCRCH